MSEQFDVILGGLDTEVDVTIADSTGVDPSVILALRGEKGDKGDTGAAGQDGAAGADGFSPIATVSKVGDTATISITDLNGTTTATVSDGTDGVDGTDGTDGTDGVDGFSPIATVTKSGDTATITITDINGTTTATVQDGTQANAFTAEFGTTTYADVKDAYDDDAILICTVPDGDNTMTLQLVYFDDTNEIFFFAMPTSDGWYWTQLSNADGWDDGQFFFASTDVATQLADGLMSALDKQKLDGLSKRNIWYGTCSTSASSSPKSITTASGDFSLTAGNMLAVLFSHTNSLSSASLQVDGGASKSAYSMNGTSDISNRWGSNEVVMFVYDGTKFVMFEQGLASTTQYGITKLNNTVTSTSTSEAATANAVKSAYDHGGVTSFNGSTGAITYTAPVTSVNGNTGAVTLTIPTDTGDLTNGAGFLDKTGILNLFYPVGSYYETSDTTFDPNNSWGGTWSLEAEGFVHIGAGANYTAGDTGGSADAIIPYHNHSVSAVTAGITGGSHSHNQQGWYGLKSASSGTAKECRARTKISTDPSEAGTNIASTHTHDLPAHNTNYAGTSGNAVGANMQPYIVVNRWHRTA